MHPIIIIGTGLAGYQLAKEFRRLDTTTPLVMITADSGDFYSKPLLSTALTSGKTSLTLANANAENMAAQLNATIYTHTHVTHIDPQARLVWTDKKESLAFSQLVLACGADAIKPPVQGDASSDILSVNLLHHYALFQERIKNKKHVTILGAGLIGCEFANDLANAGFEVHVLAPAQTPLDSLLPAEIGLLLQNALAAHNIHWHLPCTAKTIHQNAAGYELLLSDGTQLQTDLVLSAIGLLPHTALAKTAGLQTARGILVNRFLETSLPSIYAIGDCAEVEGHVLPYIAPLLNGTRALAKTLAGERTAVAYPAMPVIVKTPAHPLVICPPPRSAQGKWTITQENNSLKALFHSPENQLLGFVLTHAAVKERATLAKEVPGLF